MNIAVFNVVSTVILVVLAMMEYRVQKMKKLSLEKMEHEKLETIEVAFMAIIIGIVAGSMTLAFDKDVVGNSGAGHITGMIVMCVAIVFGLIVLTSLIRCKISKGNSRKILNAAIMIIIGLSIVVLTACIGNKVVKNEDKSKEAINTENAEPTPRVVADDATADKKNIYIDESKEEVAYMGDQLKKPTESKFKIGVLDKVLYEKVLDVVNNEESLVKAWESDIKEDKETVYYLAFGKEGADIDEEVFNGVDKVIIRLDGESNGSTLEKLGYDVSIRDGSVVLDDEEEYEGLNGAEGLGGMLSIKDIDYKGKVDLYRYIFDVVSTIDSGVNYSVYENNYLYMVNKLAQNRNNQK